MVLLQILAQLWLMLLRGMTTIPFEPSTLKTNLDALMVTLNAVHDKDVFEYKIDGRAIIFYQRDGGELNIGGFVTPESHKIWLQP